MVPDKLYIKPNVLSKATKFLQGYKPKYPDGRYQTVTQDYTNSKGKYSLSNAKNESRAQKVLQHIDEIFPSVNLRNVLNIVRSVLIKWTDDYDYVEEMIDTDDLRSRLNKAIQTRYPIYFSYDQKIRLHGPQHGGGLVFTGGGVSPARKDIVDVDVRRELSPLRVSDLIDRNISTLNLILQHEFTHVQQLRANRTSNFPVPAGKNVYTSFASPTGYARSKYQSYEKDTGRGIGSKIKYSKSLSRINPSTEPHSQYLGQPEEIMAHARGAASSLKGPYNDVISGQIEIAKYLALGRQHPAFKLFVKHLIKYMNNDVRAVTQAIQAADRWIRR